MSWLNNVNNLLTKLDGQAETMAEMVAEHDEAADEVGIDNILAKRGLSSVSSDDEEESDANDGEQKSEVDDLKEDQEIADDSKDGDKKTEDSNAVDTAGGSQLSVEKESPETVEEKAAAAKVLNEDTSNDDNKSDDGGGAVKTPVVTERQETKASNTDSLEVVSSQDPSSGKPKEDALQSTGKGLKDNSPESDDGDDEKNKTTPSNPLSSSTPGDGTAPLSLPSPPDMASLRAKVAPIQEASALLFGQKEKQRPAVMTSPGRPKRELAQAQKEARILRRHVVSLNEQLETAESELQAQRKELERAGERMEKDRIRLKQEKDAFQKRNAQETELLKSQHEKTLKEQQARFEEQLERYRGKLSEEEKRRKQQGGDWDKEMSNAIEREQEMRQTLNALEDEKAVLLSQISTLQGQQAVLGSRLESLTEAADNAMERERDAENRLDVALNQHARQITQRQARESELERTVQELNAALVVSSQGKVDEETPSRVGGNDSLLEARISALEMDLQAANSNLAIEREQSETLQIQLRSFTNETTHEATMVHAKEIQYDRKIADMSLTITKLEAEVREYEKVNSQDPNPSAGSFNDAELSNRIKVLSEEVVRLRDKIANHNSESLAMKNRLKVAVDRSKKLEDELLIYRNSPGADGDRYDSMEQNLKPGIYSKRRHGAQANGSIRNAMLLNSSRGDRAEKIGQVVDQIDSFAASTGKYLRRNPLARAGFIFYLILMHLWTFVLLFFHAHSFDTIPNSSDIGHLSHGPQAVMQQHELNKNIDLIINSDASAAVQISADKQQRTAHKDQTEEEVKAA
uniref:Golgin-84 n=1 Tax=Pseudo-nitzschia multistriata TaxID=183589 RepID=A0A448Z5I5_9STRA